MIELRGVSGVLRTGVAVLTSTSHSVSACAGIGFCVLGSTFVCNVSFTFGRRAANRTYMFLLKHLYDKMSSAKYVSAFVNL